MAIGDDFTIDTTLKTIKHTSGSTVYGVNELYTYLLDYFDEVETIRYDVPMSAQTPVEYSLINGWFIDDPSFQFLSGGAIQTSGHSNIIYTLKLQTGADSLTATEIGMTVTGGTSLATGTLLAYDNAAGKWWIRAVSGTFANNEVCTVNSLSGTTLNSAGVLTGLSVWSNTFTLGTLVAGTSLDAYQEDIQIDPWWSSGHIDILVKVRESGVLIDGGNLTILSRLYGTLYDHFVVDASAGRNPVPLASFVDNNNQTASGTVATYSDISLTFGATSQDLGNGNGSRPYDCIVDCAGRSLIQVYEYLKYITRSGSSLSVNGVEGEYYTGVGDLRLNYDNEASGPFVQGERVDGTSGAYGYIVSLIDNGTSGTMVLRNIHGGFPDGMTLSGETSGATADIDGTPDAITPNKQSPFGTFAGGKFFVARGVWLTNYLGTDANNLVLTDSTNTTQTPPNTVAILVTGVVAGDTVSVFRTTGDNGIVDRSVYTSHASANTAGAGTFTVTATIASDTPTSGTIRVVDRDSAGNFVSESSYNYTSWSGSVFTLSGTLSQTYDSDDTAYVPFIDTTASGTTVSVSVAYASDRYVVTRIRRKGILPFTVNGQLVSTGLTVTAIRTEDSIVN